MLTYKQVTLSDGQRFTLDVHDEPAEPSCGFSGYIEIQQATDEDGNRYSEEEFLELYEDAEGCDFVWEACDD